MMAICRVCLQSGIKMHVITDSKLEEMFVKLTEDTIDSPDSRPKTFCYVCYSQLQKCCRFLETFQRSDKIITGLIRSGVEMTTETLALVNQKLPRDYIVTPTTSSTVPEPRVPIKEEVKQETSDDESQEEAENGPEEAEDEPDAKKSKAAGSKKAAKLTFACDQCDRSFKLKIQLNGHKRVHNTKEKKQRR